MISVAEVGIGTRNASWQPSVRSGDEFFETP